MALFELLAGSILLAYYITGSCDPFKTPFFQKILSDNAYMLMNGRIVFEGKSEKLLGHEKFEKFCIGI